MTWPVKLADGRINLFVDGRIDARDARRQYATAQALLSRLARQPGVVLADEVGMGKTFVALTVALATAWADEKQRPVVVMVPAGLQSKWRADYELFRDRCITKYTEHEVRFAQASNGLEFFRLFDLPARKRPRVVFLTHGALGRNPEDPWVKFAILKRAMHGRHLGDRRAALPRFASRILRIASKFKDERLFDDLMRHDVSDWNPVLKRHGGELAEAAVPGAIVRVLARDKLDLGELGDQLYELPIRETASIDERLAGVRRAMNRAFRTIWQEALQLAEFRSPLIILDEAHHLKNPQTELASLFVSEALENDPEVPEVNDRGGALEGGFERMLFLTATPFQLGHAELLNVLDRFRGIHWASLGAYDAERFTADCAELRQALDHAQRVALDFDQSWKRVRQDDLQVHGEPVSPDQWWEGVDAAPLAQPERVQENHRAYVQTKAALRAAERLLQPWVIRHLRSRKLPNSAVDRRVRILGNGLRSAIPDDPAGLPVADAALLPFLLAARAQSIVAHVARTKGDHAAYRATFVEGLASSYEAFMETRKATAEAADELPDADASDDPRIRQYVKRLADALPSESAYAEHPKVAAVVGRVAALWEAGEKVVVFCHYRVTGRILVQHISSAISARLKAIATQKLAGHPETPERLLRSWDRGFDRDQPLERRLSSLVGDMLSGTALDDPEKATMIEVVRRFVRTSLFLVRYIDLAASNRPDALESSLRSRDGSGTSLHDKLTAFVHFMTERCTPTERGEYLAALGTIQPGGKDYLPHDSGEQHKDVAPLPNVRLASGGIPAPVRRRLLLGFNTPFLPEVLVASSVMAEGVDLHLNCRYMIHHDLAWNPSTIEQRTGRIDRIGAKAERVNRSIEISLPYVGGTQDEKMFRVVMDRERWFQIVMGEKFSMDELSTERAAQRVPLPDAVCRELALRLEVFNKPGA